MNDESSLYQALDELVQAATKARGWAFGAKGWETHLGPAIDRVHVLLDEVERLRNVTPITAQAE